MFALRFSPKVGISLCSSSLVRPKETSCHSPWTERISLPAYLQTVSRVSNSHTSHLPQTYLDNSPQCALHAEQSHETCLKAYLHLSNLQTRSGETSRTGRLSKFDAIVPPIISHPNGTIVAVHAARNDKVSSETFKPQVAHSERVFAVGQSGVMSSNSIPVSTPKQSICYKNTSINFS